MYRAGTRVLTDWQGFPPRTHPSSTIFLLSLLRNDDCGRCQHSSVQGANTKCSSCIHHSTYITIRKLAKVVWGYSYLCIGSEVKFVISLVSSTLKYPFEIMDHGGGGRQPIIGYHRSIYRLSNIVFLIAIVVSCSCTIRNSTNLKHSIKFDLYLRRREMSRVATHIPLLSVLTTHGKTINVHRL